MARSFRTIWAKLVPDWLVEGDGGLIGYTLMLLNDASLERLRLGHLARFPQQGPDGTPGPDDALAALGRDRGVVRGIDETSSSYAYRLTQWLINARKRGTAFQLLKDVASYVDFDGSKGCSYRIVDTRGNWFSRAADGTETYSLKEENWNWDGETSRWARFWLIIYPGTRWAVQPETWGSTTWGAAGKTWGTTALPEHGVTLRNLASDGKPGGTRCESIVIAFDENSFDPSAPEPDGTWKRWSENVDGVNVPTTRLNTARYFGGT
jgi:hypothetical protein